MLKEVLPVLTLLSTSPAIAQDNSPTQPEIITLNTAQKVDTIIQLDHNEPLTLSTLIDPSELENLTPISLDLSRNYSWRDSPAIVLPIRYEPPTLADGNLIARAINRQIQGAQSRRERDELMAQVEWAGGGVPRDFGPIILSNNPGALTTRVEVSFDGLTLEQINDSTGLLAQEFVNPEHLSFGQLGDGVGIRFAVPLGGRRD